MRVLVGSLDRTGKLIIGLGIALIVVIWILVLVFKISDTAPIIVPIIIPVPIG